MARFMNESPLEIATHAEPLDQTSWHVARLPDSDGRAEMAPSSRPSFLTILLRALAAWDA